MPVITLTTDWGTSDYFAGALKGEILSAFSNATIIDISHSINKHDQVHGAFVLKNVWNRFPAGTVHLASVTGSGEVRPSLIAISQDGHYFLGPDDGFFSLLFDDIPLEGYYVKNAKGQKVFPATREMAASAGFLAQGGKISDMGDKIASFTKKSMLQATIVENTIRGSVIYVDSFGNVITNITKEIFERVSNGKGFDIILRKSGYVINEINNDYYEAGSGNMLAHYNEAGYLEIAIHKGSASELLNLKYGDTVRIDYK